MTLGAHFIAKGLEAMTVELSDPKKPALSLARNPKNKAGPTTPEKRWDP